MRTERSFSEMAYTHGLRAAVHYTKLGLDVMHLKDEDLPILQTEMNTAQFSLCAKEYDFAKSLRRLTNAELGQDADVDISQMAKELLSMLQAHIDEG